MSVFPLKIRIISMAIEQTLLDPKTILEAETLVRSNYSRKLGTAVLSGSGYMLAAMLSVSQAAIPLNERQSLVDLYNNTDGLHWNNNAGWNDVEGSECGWYGIGCDSSASHVTTIALPGNHLRGTLPESFVHFMTDLQMHKKWL